MEGTTAAQFPFGESIFVADNDEGSRWCLRCLKWFTGKTKEKDGKCCEDPDFTCDHDDQGNCQRCKKLGKRRSELCMIIPPSHWKLAQSVINRNRTILETRLKDPDADTSADVLALMRDVTTIQSGTENHHREDSPLQAEDYFRWSSTTDRPRRDLRPVDYTSAIYVAGMEQAIKETNGGCSNADSSEGTDKTGPSVPRSSTVPAASHTSSNTESHAATPEVTAAPAYAPLPAGPVGTLRRGHSAGPAIDLSNFAANLNRLAPRMMDGANEQRLEEAANEANRLKALFDNACLQLGRAYVDAMQRGNHRG